MKKPVLENVLSCIPDYVECVTVYSMDCEYLSKYDGKNSIDTALNNCLVDSINFSDLGIEIYLVNYFSEF